MTEETLMFLIFWGLIFNAGSHAIIAAILDTNNCDVFYTPKTIYRKTNMNWFGSICIYILIFPFSFILSIGGFLRWLFTVGRK